MGAANTTAAQPHVYKMVEHIADALHEMQCDGSLPDNADFNRVVQDLYEVAMDLLAAETAHHVQAIERNQRAA